MWSIGYTVITKINACYLHNIWIIPWTFVGPETSSLSSTSACSTQKFRKLAVNCKIKHTQLNTYTITMMKEICLYGYKQNAEVVPCIYYFKKFVLKLCSQNLQLSSVKNFTIYLDKSRE